MKCPNCQHHVSQVIDSRGCRGAVRKRRRCQSCQFHWTTDEIIEDCKNSIKATLDAAIERMKAA